LQLSAALLWARFARFYLMRLQLNAKSLGIRQISRLRISGVGIVIGFMQ